MTPTRSGRHCWLRRTRHHFVGRTERVPLGDYELVKPVVVCKDCGWHSLMGAHMYRESSR